MNIRIDHIAKIEGHAGFMASVVNGDVKSAKLEVQEGIRLIEGILIGRHYADVPIVAQRICGICPVVHNLTAIKAVESALGVKVTPETVHLRQLMEWGQIIHSHAIHLFFLALADYFNIENDLKLVKEYPEEAKKAIEMFNGKELDARAIAVNKARPQESRQRGGGFDGGRRNGFGRVRQNRY